MLGSLPRSVVLLVVDCHDPVFLQVLGIQLPPPVFRAADAGNPFEVTFVSGLPIIVVSEDIRRMKGYQNCATTFFVPVDFPHFSFESVLELIVLFPTYPFGCCSSETND